MTRFLTLPEILWLHEQVVTRSGGAAGLRDIAGLESAVAQPRMTFAGVDLYPSVVEKAAALAFSLVSNHPFVDGNKRIGHAAMETMLEFNGVVLDAPIDEHEEVFLGLAAGAVTRDELIRWLRSRTAGCDGGESSD